MPPYVAEPREQIQGESGSLLKGYEDLIMEVGRTERRYSAEASPQSPRSYFPVAEKKSSESQTTQETPATDSDKSEPRPDQGILITTFQGLQHTLQNPSQGIKELIRNKKLAQKAYTRRERRRAAR
jgi:hypothetical protein